MSFPSVKSYATFDPITSLTIQPIGAIFHSPQVNQGPARGLWSYSFFLTGTSTPQNVYQDGALTVPFSPTGVVTADAFGRFPAIYLDNSVAYKVQLLDTTSAVQQSLDPYNPAMATTGLAQVVSAIGPVINAQGEMTLTEAASGGSGNELSVTAGLGGALKIQGITPGVANIIADLTVTTGAQVATFAATNMPGTGFQFLLTLTAAPAGGAYVGGTLTAPFTGTTSGAYTVVLSTGQVITGATLTNGSTALVTPSTVIAGAPTTSITATFSTGVAGWLPVQADGVLYYTPIFNASGFSPYKFLAQGYQSQIINAAGFTFNGGSTLTLAGSGATATPATYFSPPQAGVGTNTWFQPTVTNNGGLAGLKFINSLTGSGSALTGVWTNIGSGLNVGANGAAPLSGTYQLATSSGGTPVVANGTITLSGGNGAQPQTLNAGALTFNANGTITQIGSLSTITNWFTPTTSAIGSSFFLQMNVTGGVGNLGGIVPGTYTAMSPAISVYGVANATGNSGQVSGTWAISTGGSSATAVASGTFDLQDTANSSGFVTSLDFTPPSGLTFDISGAIFSPGGRTQIGEWFFPIGSPGATYYLTVSPSGSGTLGGIVANTPTPLTSNITPTATGGNLSCTYTISNSATGAPILCKGAFGLTSAAFGGQTDTYATAGTFTETIPSGASQLVLEVWGAPGGGGAGEFTTKPFETGGGGASGGYSRRTIALSSGDWGKTIHTVVGGSGAGLNGTASSASSGTRTITTQTGGGGTQGGAASVGVPGPGGTPAGTASGGTTNTTGNVGVTGGAGGAGIVGLNGTGVAGAHGSNTNSPAAPSGAGLIIYKYT